MSLSSVDLSTPPRPRRFPPADELARAAGVTRGALYHQFDGKTELFAAVFEQMEDQIAQSIGTHVLASGAEDPAAALRAGVDAWLAASADPDVHRIVLIEAPAALGWERWREIGRRYGVGLVEAALAAVIAQGILPQQPARPLAHVLVGAFEEAALYASRAEDRDMATDEVRAALHQLVDALTTAARAASRQGD